MECHSCKYTPAIERGDYAGVPFSRSPCSRCPSHDVQASLIPFDPARDGEVFVQDPEAEFASADRERLLEAIRALLGLAAELRDAVCLRSQNLSFKEIGRRQGVGPAAVEKRVQRACRAWPVLVALFPRKTARRVRWEDTNGHGSA